MVFVRSRAGDDPVNCLWVLDAVSGDERLVADPREPLSDAVEEKLPDAERARRERARESAGGVVSYATDAAGLVAVFALGGGSSSPACSRPRPASSTSKGPSSTRVPIRRPAEWPTSAAEP